MPYFDLLEVHVNYNSTYVIVNIWKSLKSSEILGGIVWKASLLIVFWTVTIVLSPLAKSSLYILWQSKINNYCN